MTKKNSQKHGLGRLMLLVCERNENKSPAMRKTAMLNNSFIKQYSTLNPNYRTIMNRSSMLPFLVPLDSAQVVFSRHFNLFSICFSFLSPSQVKFNSPFIIHRITMALLTNELRFSACHQPSLANLLLFPANASVVTLLTHCQSTYCQVYRIHGMPRS